MRFLSLGLSACLLTSVASLPASAEPTFEFEAIAPPVGEGSREPNLAVTSDGALWLSWMEGAPGGVQVRAARLDGSLWTTPETISASPDLFVNWADFPSIAAFADGTLVAHWLQSSRPFSYSYDVNLAFSDDAGRSWSNPVTPHRDRTEAQHGFVSLLPFGQDVLALWLDGRAYDGALLEDGAVMGGTQLRTAVLSPDGTVSPDTAIDYMTCSCCQTSATVAGDTPLVAYRDRTGAEIRDIAVVALRDGVWSEPRPVHDDNWQLSGCPVNGPAISAEGENVIVAWFTAADDRPLVQIAFSSDAGESFDGPARIDLGDPVGRVDALMMDDGTAVVSWLEWSGTGEVLMICHATATGCRTTRQVTINSDGGSMNFPRMAATREHIYLAWTQPTQDGSDTVRLVRSPL